MNVRSKNLLKACETLENNTSKDIKYRPKYHISPKVGWLNDPNGLCQYNGLYHIFYQYSPFDTKPGLNYWGHCTTKDFIHYEYHQPALCSDEKFDCHGVYSGSALVENGQMNIFYTGNVKQVGNFNYITNGREHNLVKVTSKDGFTFNGKHLVMTNSDYPKDVTCHVRDPKVWKEDDTYYMVLGARRIDDVGEALIYQSSDLETWKLINRLTTKEKFGYMWECPDIYNFNDVKILAVSPQGVEPLGYKYNNIYQSGYFIIDGNFKGEYKLSEFTELDNGFDFYAPQSFVDDNGRRILIGWLGLPDIDEYYSNPTKDWVHMLTIPRELSFKDGKVHQQPLEELKRLRKSTNNFMCSSERTFNIGTSFELIVEGLTNDFTIQLNDAIISYSEKVFKLEFGKSGMGRTFRAIQIDRVYKVQIFCDKSSLEIFLNDGENVLSSRFYPNDNIMDVTIKTNSADVKLFEI
ncbi:MAG: glycoside hydrolase family 32 protein [Ruminococcus sp.]|nr:glycoside hydrolase family 32 protein [Ruminococcus sp.]